MASKQNKIKELTKGLVGREIFVEEGLFGGDEQIRGKLRMKNKEMKFVLIVLYDDQSDLNEEQFTTSRLEKEFDRIREWAIKKGLEIAKKKLTTSSVGKKRLDKYRKFGSFELITEIEER